MGWIGWIILGGLAGWVANLIMGSKGGILKNIVIGIIGGVVGGGIVELLGGSGVSGFNIYSFVVAVFGALILVWLARLVNKK
jgi:uncharacterized membrane protein YeaQ/YmgE (transglycosylase-associated protein family)